MRGLLGRLATRAPSFGLGVASRVIRWWEHQRTPVHLLSYPGCGRTWLTLLIGKSLVDHYKLDGANPINVHELHGIDPRVPRMTVRHDGRPQLRAPGEVERDKSRFA